MGVPGGFDPTLLPPRLQTRCGKSGRRRQFLPGEEEEEEEGRIDEKEASSKVCCSGSHFKGLLLLLLLPCSAEALLPEFLQYNNCFNSPPKFSGCMTNITADLGDNVVLTCQVSETSALCTGQKCDNDPNSSINAPLFIDAERLKFARVDKY